MPSRAVLIAWAMANKKPVSHCVPRPAHWVSHRLRLKVQSGASSRDARLTASRGAVRAWALGSGRTRPLRPTIKRLCGKGATASYPWVEQLLAGAGYPPPATAKRPGHSEHLRVALASEQPHPSAKRSVPPAEPLRPPGRALRVVAPRWCASGHLQQAGKPYAVRRGRSAIRHVRFLRRRPCRI